MSEKLDTKEFEFPKTTFSHDIETRVIQIIILQALNKIGGVALLEGRLFDTLFGREIERVKGIIVEQDSKNHSLKVKIEINVEYGVTIPEITAKVQERVVEEIVKLTGLHVASVHVVVKGLVQQAEVMKEEHYPASLLESESAT